MSESEYNPLRDKSWRRKRTPAEAGELEAWLAKHPEAQADWEVDVRLTEVIHRLPDAPVPSNFTARVLQAVERESAAASRRSGPFWKRSLRSLLPKVAVAAVVLGAGLLTYREHMVAEHHRPALAQNVKIPSPQDLQDFETIQKMGSANPGPDRELIALLK